MDPVSIAAAAMAVPGVKEAIPAFVSRIPELVESQQKFALGIMRMNPLYVVADAARLRFGGRREEKGDGGAFNWTPVVVTAGILGLAGLGVAGYFAFKKVDQATAPLLRAAGGVGALTNAAGGLVAQTARSTSQVADATGGVVDAVGDAVSSVAEGVEGGIRNAAALLGIRI
jgi:hypothetical protein